MLNDVLLLIMKSEVPTVGRMEIVNEVSASGQLRIKSGANGTVYWGKLKGRPVVVKEFKADVGRAKVWAECNMQYALGHEPRNHVLQPIAFVEWRNAYVDSNSAAIVGDAEGSHVTRQERYGICFPCGTALSDVLQMLRQVKSSAVGLDRRLGWIRAIAEGVANLHSEGVTHRDLKPANIIMMSGPGLDVRGEAFLTDFGSAKVVETMGHARASADAGTLQYTAPEVLRDEPRDYTRVDVYALSVLSWEVLSGKVPFGCVPDAGLREMVKSGDRPEIPDGWPSGAVAAIARGWDGDASQRGSAQDFVRTMFGPSAPT
jgi:serine/threonine protein kinase